MSCQTEELSSPFVSGEESGAQAGASHTAGNLSQQAGIFSGNRLGVCMGKAKPGGFVPNVGGSLSLASCRASKFGNSWVGRHFYCSCLFGKWGCHTSMMGSCQVSSICITGFCPKGNSPPSDFLQSHQLESVTRWAMKCNALQMYFFTHSFIQTCFSLQEHRFYVPWGVEGKAGLITCAMPRLAAMYKYMVLHIGMNKVASASLTSARIQLHGLCLPDKEFNSAYSTQYL